MTAQKDATDVAVLISLKSHYVHILFFFKAIRLLHTLVDAPTKAKLSTSVNPFAFRRAL